MATDEWSRAGKTRGRTVYTLTDKGVAAPASGRERRSGSRR
jgi:hypothetical protein